MHPSIRAAAPTSNNQQFLSLILLLFVPFLAFAQIKPIIPQGTTRAVVIGISNYQNEQITDLRFADADARAFADYLMSDAGGKVTVDNLRLLTNEKATQGQMAAAFTWLADASQAGDKAIIYFSGHGDMETLTGLSFLLAHDASATAYSGGGSFPVIFLQAIINRLSTQKQVQVILITDACRAGKLAGNEINGTQATAKLLSDQFANEVKILSCQPNEFSLESQQWGGGRGVFSWYLLDGLRGLADHNRDQSVSLLEIGRYLEDKVPAAVAPHTQIPMVVGNKSGTVALVDAPTLANLQDQHAQTFETDGNIASRRDAALMPKEDTLAQRWLLAFEQAIRQKNLLMPTNGSAWHWLQQLETRPVMTHQLTDLRLRLSAQLQDDAQTAINDYLAADPRELRRRWGFDDRYEKLPEYLEKAAELLGNEHFMYNRLIARAHYFRGLNLRLRGERNNQPALFNQALLEQEKALQYDRDAVFALNESGHLNFLLEKSRQAITLYEKAIALSPRWVLPWSNRCSAHIDLQELDKAEQCGLKALSLDSTFVMALYNVGLCYQKMGRYPEATSYYQKTLYHDTEYPKAHFNLGIIYYVQGDYVQSRAAFEAYRERVPGNPTIYQNLGEVARKLDDPVGAEQNFQQALTIDPNHAGTHLSLAEFEIALGQEGENAEQAVLHYQKAEQYLNTFIRLEKDNAEGYYQLAGVQARLMNDREAIQNLERALEKGFKDKSRIEKDVMFQPVRHQNNFRQLIGKM